MKNPYEVLLYYKYVGIKNPEKLMQEQLALCKKLFLKGRIIIAKEGINGTIEGLEENTEAYTKALRRKKIFKDIRIKKSEGTGTAFPRLSVRVRDEIVTGSLAEADFNPNECTGEYLTAEKLHSWFRSKKKKFHVVDMRNEYEYRVGH